jgi:lecithin-cholesterol acyltransferase
MVVALLVAFAAAPPAHASARTPIVLFPAFHFTKLRVTVHGQSVDRGCPRSGSFEDWFLNDDPSTTFSQVCRDELMTLRYLPVPFVPMPRRFFDQRGVSVSIIDYGSTASAPFYEPMYEALEAAGYVRDRDIRVAGYDSRLGPDQDGFLERTKRLIEATYRANGNTPVHLVGHSNGPIYAEYLLTHTSRAWKARYIHGFTPIAGNFPGQGSLYPILFTGLNIEDFSFPTTVENARSSARMYLSAPSSYISAADPRVFGSRETVVEDEATGRDYTPRDYPRLFSDAGLPWARQIADYYIGFTRMSSRASFPMVDVYAEKGSGIDTVVGLGLHGLTVGQPLDPALPAFTRDGDVNQEDITNEAVGAWRAMPCFHFSLTDNPGVDHFSLPSDPNVLARLVADLARPRSDC